MQVELKANGKTVQVEMTEEQLKELGVIKPRTGYERMEKDSTYFFNVASGDTSSTAEAKHTVEQDFYDNGNYYSDCEIAENNARADRLFRQLRRWQALNDKAITKKDWEDINVGKIIIFYNYECCKIRIACRRTMRHPNVVYFTSREKAKEAIEVFKDELLWYFTEYQQRLDEE